MAATEKFTIIRDWSLNLNGVRARFSHRASGAYAGLVIAPVPLQIHSGNNRRLTFFTNSLRLGAYLTLSPQIPLHCHPTSSCCNHPPPFSGCRTTDENRRFFSHQRRFGAASALPQPQTQKAFDACNCEAFCSCTLSSQQRQGSEGLGKPEGGGEVTLGREEGQREEGRGLKGQRACPCSGVSKEREGELEGQRRACPKTLWRPCQLTRTG